MRIKKLFNTEDEYLDYAWSLINFDRNKIWKEEDLPKLQPFFDYTSKPCRDRLMNEEEKEGFDFYEKCKKEYADELFEIQDSIHGYDKGELCEFLLLEPIDMNCYDYDEEGNEIDEEGNVIPSISRETIKLDSSLKGEMKFPLMFVGFIDSTFDRFGPARMCYSEFVNLEDFKV